MREVNFWWTPSYNRTLFIVVIRCFLVKNYSPGHKLSMLVTGYKCMNECARTSYMRMFYIFIAINISWMRGWLLTPTYLQMSRLSVKCRSECKWERSDGTNGHMTMGVFSTLLAWLIPSKHIILSPQPSASGSLTHCPRHWSSRLRIVATHNKNVIKIITTHTWASCSPLPRRRHRRRRHVLCCLSNNHNLCYMFYFHYY